MLRIGVFFIGIFFCISCKKNTDTTIDIRGSVSDRINDLPIEGVSVLLEIKDFGGTTFTNSFSELATTLTNENGNYEISFQNSNAIEYRFTFSKLDHFSDQIIVNPDLLSINQLNTIDYDIYSSSYLILNISNSVPFNSNDELILGSELISSSVGSCFSNIISLSGANADTTIECEVYGNQRVKFDYFVTKDNFTSSYSDSVFCSAGDTLTKYIFY